jgi:hypothetical protein
MARLVGCFVEEWRHPKLSGLLMLVLQVSICVGLTQLIGWMLGLGLLEQDINRDGAVDPEAICLREWRSGHKTERLGPELGYGMYLREEISGLV